MATFKEARAILSKIVGHDRVYFQPPESIKMAYPAVVFHLSDLAATRGSNTVFSMRDRYTVTVMDKQPFPEYLYDLQRVPYTSLDTTYRVNGLNHFVYTMYL